MRFTACGCDSYGGTCPACLAKQNRMATCKHGPTGNCQLCLAEINEGNKMAICPHGNRAGVCGACKIAYAAQSDFGREPYLGIFPKTDSALATQIGGEHYKDCKIQPVQFIEANALQFLEGNVLKRITRHNKPTGKGRQDIEKAIHELQLLLELRYPTVS